MLVLIEMLIKNNFKTHNFSIQKQIIIVIKLRHKKNTHTKCVEINSTSILLPKIRLLKQKILNAQRNILKHF